MKQFNNRYSEATIDEQNKQLRKDKQFTALGKV